MTERLGLAIAFIQFHQHSLLIVKELLLSKVFFFLFGFSYISEHHYFKFIAFFSIFLTSEVCCSA